MRVEETKRKMEAEMKLNFALIALGLEETEGNIEDAAAAAMAVADGSVIEYVRNAAKRLHYGLCDGSIFGTGVDWYEEYHELLDEERALFEDKYFCTDEE